MKRYIVSTSIHPPTEALRRFAAMDDWNLIVVGDLATPHREYDALDCLYLGPDDQRQRYPELSAAIPWRSIQRRNIGFVEAWRRGADVVATVDDDNLPYDDWGKDLLIGRDVEIDLYRPELDVFDPLAVTSASGVWHRGYPVQYLPRRHRLSHLGKTTRRVLVQADLWDGDPDIDAIARLALAPKVELEEMAPFGATCLAPFDSQNTFLAREVLPYYAVLPFVGRVDDIWGGYLLQARFPDSVAFNRASVYQQRNEQDPLDNLEDELFGYRHTIDFVRGGCRLDQPFVPAETRRFYDVYRAQF